MFLYQAKNTARIDSFRLLFKKWHLIALNVVIITLTTVTNIGSTWALKTIVDVAIPQKQMDTLFFAIAALVFLPVLSMFLVYGNNMISVKISGHITDSLRNRMFEKITRLSPNIMSKYKVGDLVARVTRSCGWVGEAYVQSVVLPGISSAFMFIGILIFLFFLNWQLTLVSLLIVPLLIAASIFAGKKSKQKNEQLYAFLQKADSYFTEVISGIKTVQMYTQEKRECDYVSQWIKDHRKISNQANILHIWVIDILNKFEQAFGTGLVLAFGAWQVLGGGLTVGSLIAFTIYIPQLYTYGEKIQRIYVSSKQFAPTIKGIEEILELPDEFVDILQAVPMETIKGNIQFHNVSFSYAENRGKVQDISFVVKPGERVAIVGPTGGGKSTLLDLLMRFYDPDEGEIYIDERNLREYRIKDLRRKVSIVSQDIHLWNRSIRDNLTYVDPNVTEEQIRQAVRIAQLYDFIESLPEKYDTIIGDRGLKLSGGERQRLAIARTILRNPQIILLDEPTSALDALTEELLQKELEKLFRGKTVIVVAHRFATIRSVDRIIVVDNGRIVEDGIHSALMKHQGIYYEMYSKQFMEQISQEKALGRRWDNTFALSEKN